ncbi:MAG: hypothetical protein L0M06_14365 [Enterococcus sp.]|uniref:DUF7006 family protein n=1 Tax=Enterococcus sp. TaxID=35783 RepID=UPI0026489533|nr:hypothetical protein [Enterococcus sp.]MDN6004484.1 hypothetical protein [Enterococcus sp.]MDN6517804.1 hypothetical protein [Enterococcus sp.]MDN6561340.1 hypothetical protein [Enterococcus sp.]MDN6617545.1 hypothetical protein [Enterococcus sp.]MDN6777732.1 hypothetical protein [Enterococcus sp.]
MKKAVYYWDIKEEELLPKATPSILVAYFRKQKEAAQTIIRELSGENLVSSISELNGIDEKLILFFFYLDPRLREFQELKNPARVIELIEKDYTTAFFDVLHPNPYKEIRQRSLIWKLPRVNDDKGTLWDVDFFQKELEKKDEVLRDNLKFKFIQSYYLFLIDEAENLCRRINGSNFNEKYPLLLVIDCILQVLLEVMDRNQEYLDSCLEFEGLFERDLQFLVKERFDNSFGRYSERSIRRQLFIKDFIPTKK